MPASSPAPLQNASSDRFAHLDSCPGAAGRDRVRTKVGEQDLSLIGTEIDTRRGRSLTSNVEGSRISRSGELDVMAEGYCVRCKAKQPIAEAVEEVMKNGRKAVKGKCPVCGVVMFKILGGKATPSPAAAPAAPAAESPTP